MKLVFVDTGALYALADRKDPAHARAKEWLRGNAAPLLLTDFVFAETMSLLTKRLNKRVAVEFGRGVRTSPRFRIEEPSPAVRERAWTLFSTQPDKDYDLIDCLSFATMERFHADTAFAFDGHFEQRGFKLVPGGR